MYIFAPPAFLQNFRFPSSGLAPLGHLPPKGEGFKWCFVGAGVLDGPHNRREQAPALQRLFTIAYYIKNLSLIGESQENKPG